jgi:serine/threonine protein kinase
MLSRVIEENLRLTEERFIGFWAGANAQTFTEDAIEIFNVHYETRRGPLDFCLGMTLYNQHEMRSKGVRELRICHYIANLIAYSNPNPLGPTDLFPSSEDTSNIIEETIGVVGALKGLCATPNIVSYIDLYALHRRIDRDPSLVRLAAYLTVLPDVHNYTPSSVALSILKQEDGFIQHKIEEWLEKLHELGLAKGISFKRSPNAKHSNKIRYARFTVVGESRPLGKVFSEKPFLAEGKDVSIIKVDNKGDGCCYVLKAYKDSLHSNAILEFIALRELAALDFTVNARSLNYILGEVLLVMESLDQSLYTVVTSSGGTITKQQKAEWRRQLLTTIDAIHTKAICSISIGISNCFVKNGRLSITIDSHARFFTYSQPYNLPSVNVCHYRDIRLNKILLSSLRMCLLENGEPFVAVFDTPVKQHGEVDIYAAGMLILELELGFFPVMSPNIILENGDELPFSNTPQSLQKTIEDYYHLNYDAIEDLDVKFLVKQMLSENHELRPNASQCLYA